ncbi:MAG: hypothetical protein RIE24_07735 [Silicimonas sp.]
MTMKTGLLSAVCAAAIATGAVAQDNTPVNPANIDLGQRMSMAYSTFSYDLFEDLLAPEQVLRLFILTKQEVASIVCDGFTLDQERLTAAMNKVVNTQPMTDGEYNTIIFGRIMHGHGVFKGGEMALATFDPIAYCAYGTQVIEELSDEDSEGLLVLSAAE